MKPKAHQDVPLPPELENELRHLEAVNPRLETIIRRTIQSQPLRKPAEEDQAKTERGSRPWVGGRSVSLAPDATPRWRRDWLAYTARVEARLAAGSAQFGDANLDAEPVDLLREIQEELLDLAGWGSILWSRLERFRRELESK